MELKKTNERYNHPFDENEEAMESTLESVQFRVTDDEGNDIGQANIRQGDGNANINFIGGGGANININGYNGIDRGITMMKKIFGIGD